MKILLMLVTILAGCSADAGGWKRLAALPDPEGFAGAFAGTSDGALLFAGGANFPDKRPWEGGKKVWYDTVFVLEKPDGEWKVAGKLPRPLGYGVSVTHKEGVVCVGGSDANRYYAEAFRLEWKSGQLVTSDLPPLPRPVANGCGALVGDDLYVVGGQDKPEATSTLRTVWRIDLAAPKPGWQEVEALPGRGRMLAVAAGFEGALWVVGGTDLVAEPGGKAQRRYLKDAFRFDPGKGWKQVADLPHATVAAASPAPSDPSGFLILGGDDGAQVGVAPEQHRGFERRVLRYDARTDRWIKAGELPAARVTVPCVAWNGSWVVPSGEARPGVRSAEVWCLTPAAKE